MSESFFQDDIVKKYFPDSEGEKKAPPPEEQSPAVEEPTGEEPLPLAGEPAPAPPPAAEQPTAGPAEPEGPRLNCANCGAELPSQSKFCPECGAPVSLPLPLETAVGPARAETGRPMEAPVVPGAAPPPAGLPQIVPLVTAPRPVTPAVVPPVPADKPPPRWPWMTLLIAGGILAGISLLCACLLLFAAPNMADEEVSAQDLRWFALLCCALPGLLLAAVATFGGFQAFRRAKD
ncbi:MAG: zinc ribbon domain-containing protein [Chloroflexia bacterium]|nr:zinc ribbon domain-containing protein [Chloroflexia bacterium]